MKLAIFGGTFDPIHTGHLLIAEAARTQFHLDRVIFLPAGIAPYKKKPMAAAKQRLAMTRLATRGNPAFRVSDWDVRQKVAAYTYQALQHFKRVFPKARLFFILGSDALHDLPTWRHGTELLRESRFLVIERREAPWSSLPRALRKGASRVSSPLWNISSRELRARLARGASVRYQIPEPVLSYIQKHRLYKRKAV